jgi:hypothetical protein
MSIFSRLKEKLFGAKAPEAPAAAAAPVAAAPVAPDAPAPVIPLLDVEAVLTFMAEQAETELADIHRRPDEVARHGEQSLRTSRAGR